MQPEVKQPEVVQNSAQPAQMSDNVLAAVATIPLIGLIIYYAMPNASAFVKYYAKHGIGLLVGAIVIFAIEFVPVLGWAVGSLLNLVLFIAWIILLINALQNKMYRMPVLTDLVEKYVK